ncbi:MAG: Nif11-like leader peptide family natural product precursor [Cyanobacteria bacterium P01_G01_bin.38]
MSKKNVSNFLQAISRHSALTERLKAMTRSSELLEIAAEFGYDFTEQELFNLTKKSMTAM